MVLTWFSGQSWSRLLEWWLVFLLGLAPFGWISWQVLFDPFSLGADPAKTIVLFTGIWTLRWLWLTLAVTPVRKLFRWGWPMRYRRMWGLYCWFYATLHLMSFVAFILGWRMDLLTQELAERPYIIVGFTAFLLLAPLGFTSTKKMQRRLGKRWLQLHKLVYLIAILAMVHFIWLVRSSWLEVSIYGVILMLLLGYRLRQWSRSGR